MARLGLLAVALAALAAGASAATVWSFPYATCARSPSPYIVTALDVLADGTFCFNVGWNAESKCVGNEANYCCSAGIHKLELDANPGCMPGFKAEAWLADEDGQVLRNVSAPKLRRPPNAAATKATMYVANLGIAGNTEQPPTLCVRITSGACNTVDKLVPPSSGGFKWSAALWDDKHKCCPVSKDKGCPSTQVWKIDPAGYDFSAPGNKATAEKAIEAILDQFTEVTGRSFQSRGTVNFIDFTDDFGASWTSAQINVTFYSEADGAAYADFINEGLGFSGAVRPVFGDQQCFNGVAPLLEGDGCAPTLLTDAACSLDGAPPPPENIFPTVEDFPYCPCRNEPFTTKFNPTFIDMTDTEYTINVTADGMLKGKKYCNSVDTLRKIEYYLTDALKTFVLGARVSYTRASTGEVVDNAFVAPSWGGITYPNTLKVSGLDLTLADLEAQPLSVTLLLRDGAPAWSTISATGTSVVVALYDPRNKCCPAYPLELPSP